jgi:hypothetical protein
VIPVDGVLHWCMYTSRLYVLGGYLLGKRITAGSVIEMTKEGLTRPTTAIVWPYDRCPSGCGGGKVSTLKVVIV